MEDAPIPNPAAASIALRLPELVVSPAPSHHAIREIPRRPSPPTESPITAPPLYETAKAAGCPPLLAAIAVLPLAEVAALIPENPAPTDARAPAKNAIVVSGSPPFRNQRSTPTTTTKIQEHGTQPLGKP